MYHTICLKPISRSDSVIYQDVAEPLVMSFRGLHMTGVYEQTFVEKAKDWNDAISHIGGVY